MKYLIALAAAAALMGCAAQSAPADSSCGDKVDALVRGHYDNTGQAPTDQQLAAYREASGCAPNE